MLMENTGVWIVRSLSTGMERRWDEFVKAQSAGTFFHLSGWRHVIDAAFGHACHYLYAERGGAIGGVLPLVHMKSRLFGNVMSSTPFCSYGGVIATDAAARAALVDAACELAADLNVDYLEFRNLEAGGLDWPAKDLYVTFRVPLDPDPEKNFQAIGPKRRNMVRRGMRAGLETDLNQDVGRHYRLYAEMVRNLGTPVFSRRYFELLKRVFGDDCEILTVTHQGCAVSAMLSFYFRDEMLAYYGGGAGQARSIKSNDYLYWALIERACERGARTFDAGRSKRGTGSFNFKSYWGWRPRPLHYEYRLMGAKAVPNLSPANPKYRPLINAWKRLPLPLACAIGPMLARNLG